MNLTELNKVAEAMVAPGRGILAADEFDRHHQEALRRHRRRNRRRTRGATTAKCCSASTEAMSKYISGVILYDETIRQNAKDGTPLVKLIEKGRLDSRHQGRQGAQAAAVLPERGRSPRASTACASGSSNIAGSAPNSPNGAR